MEGQLKHKKQITKLKTKARECPYPGPHSGIIEVLLTTDRGCSASSLHTLTQLHNGDRSTATESNTSKYSDSLVSIQIPTTLPKF